MKKLILVLALALVAPVFHGCSSAPSERVQTVTTLKVIGASVDSLMQTAAKMYKSGEITQEQWNKVATVHDEQFLPAYNLAVTAARADLSSLASPDLVNLANQLSSIILSLQKK